MPNIKKFMTQKKDYYEPEGGGGHTGFYNIGMWHFTPKLSFQSQMDPKLFNLIPIGIIVAPKTSQRFKFCIWEISKKKNWEIFFEML